MEKYGTSLIYVRYRYDEDRGIRRTTVELVEEEMPWRPRKRRRDGDIVEVSIGYREKAERELLKGLGGRWDPEAKLWRVVYGAIKGTGLEKRIMPQVSDAKRK